MPSQDRMDIERAPPSSGHGFMDAAARERELDEKHPNRPKNQKTTLPFHTLFQDLFQPLIEEQQKKGPTGPAVNRRRLGPDGGNNMNTRERKQAIIERYISRWRRDVGDDFYPAFRLIVPEKDRDRAMYGLKEKVLGRYLIKIMKIDKSSADASKMLNWKAPAQGSAAGDFPERCYEVLAQRPSRVEVGNMTIAEVNERLDELAAAPKEEEQLPIMTNFYRQMNAEEMRWLIKIILRQMKIGSTEKTFFHLWHPDAESLFNISSSLRRVCWELYNPNVRLEGEDRGVALMSCFQPQLANFQVNDFKKIVARMRPTEDDKEFWIEEKLDGERMQLHMVTDDEVPGARRFRFWSRKAKEYTYLYGESLYDKNGSLTQHLADAFADAVESIILDGEMVTWDPEQDIQAMFGTLKTAALSEQKNPFAGKIRPLFRIFDILLLNGKQLTQYVLRDRRAALLKSIRPVRRRFEIHEYAIGTSADDIEPHLRRIVEEASEGLVIKNPRSAYRTGDRNDDWIKVKPEYMIDYGESLECLVIGAYYGSGRRGGGFSSFLCGLRANEPNSKKVGSSQKFISFFKVGGGMKAEDYDTFRYITDGKWIDWDPKRPPTEYIELAGGPLQRERPDAWIKPEDSFVVQVKGAQITQSDEFAPGLTLRFPRYVKLRQDKSWQTALSVQDFLDLKASKESEREHKQFEVDNERRKRRKVMSRIKPLKVVGYGAQDLNEIKADEDALAGAVFHGLIFFVMTDSTKPAKKTKPQLEELIKANGGSVVQTHDLEGKQVYCIAERRTVGVASLQKMGDVIMIRPIWLFDCIDQAKSDFAKGLPQRALAWEADRHLYYVPDDEATIYEGNVDRYGDSYCRNTTIEELRELMAKMAEYSKPSKKGSEKLVQLMGDRSLSGWMFKGIEMFFDVPDVDGTNGALGTLSATTWGVESARTTAAFAGAKIATNIDDSAVTHIVVSPNSDLRAVRKAISSRSRIPRLVTSHWIEDSWKEKTLIDEERYTPR